MNKEDLLAELGSYFAAMKKEDYVRSIGPEANPNLIKVYQVQGAIVRKNDRAETHDVVFFVYDEGGAGEHAYYNGDPINFFWSLKVIDHITVTNVWSGRIFRSFKPVAICRVLDTPAGPEKWIHLEETDPDWDTTPPTITEITGGILDF